MSSFKRVMDECTDYHRNLTTELVINSGISTALMINAVEGQKVAHDRLMKRKAERRTMKEENEQLKKENAKLVRVATNIALDRAAILTAIDSLAKRWGKEIDEQTAKEIEAVIDEEKKKIRLDRAFVSEKRADIEAVAKKI